MIHMDATQSIQTAATYRSHISAVVKELRQSNQKIIKGVVDLSLSQGVTYAVTVTTTTRSDEQVVDEWQ